MQSYTFIDDVSRVEKPPLYDQINSFNLWVPWILFVAPFHITSAIICKAVDICSQIFVYFPDLGGVKFPVTSIIYSYLAASWFAHSWNKWVDNASSSIHFLLFLIT